MRESEAEPSEFLLLCVHDDRDATSGIDHSSLVEVWEVAVGDNFIAIADDSYSQFLTSWLSKPPRNLSHRILAM